MLANFDPTLLLVMQHNVTGLKYFCKTSVLDRVNWYKGSGSRWTNHLNMHGRDVSVGVMGLYTDKQKCLEAALKFSIDHNIANSDEWANLVDETGMMGASMKGKRNPFYGRKHSPETLKKISQNKIGVSTNKGANRSPEQRAKISASLKGHKNPAVTKALTGRTLSEETRKKISIAGKGRKHSMETKQKLSQMAKVQWARQKSAEEQA
jgi:hypothetical protein